MTSCLGCKYRLIARSHENAEDLDRWVGCLLGGDYLGREAASVDESGKTVSARRP